jgi:hypothetical protein
MELLLAKTAPQTLPIGKQKPGRIKFTPKTYHDIYKKLTRSTKNDPMDWFETDLSQLDQRVYYVRNDKLAVVLGIINRKEIIGLKYIVLNQLPRMEFFFNTFLMRINKPVIVIVSDFVHFTDHDGITERDIGEFTRAFKEGRRSMSSTPNTNINGIIFRIPKQLPRTAAQLQYLVQAPWYRMRLEVIDEHSPLIADYLNELDKRTPEELFAPKTVGAQVKSTGIDDADFF